MDVHSPKNGIFIGIDPYPFLSTKLDSQGGPSISCNSFFASVAAWRLAASPLTSAGSVSSALRSAAAPSASARAPKLQLKGSAWGVGLGCLGYVGG